MEKAIKTQIKSIDEVSNQERNLKKLANEPWETAQCFETGFNYSGFGIFVFNPLKNRIIKTNDLACRMFGYSRKKLLSMSIDSLFPKQSDRFGKFFQEVLDKGCEGLSAVSAKHQNNKIFAAEISAAPIQQEDGNYFLICIHDVSKQTNAEQALQTSEQKFRALVENMQEGVIIVNNSDIIQFANKSLYDMLGYKKEELAGKVGYQVLFSKKNQKLIQGKNRLRSKKVADQYEVQIKKNSGEEIWVHISGVPILDHNQNVTGSFGIITDINKQKLAEIALKNAHGQLENSVKKRTSELLKSNQLLQQEIKERIKIEKKQQTRDIAERKRMEQVLKNAKDELEMRVEERTLELSEANKILMEQIVVRQQTEEQLKQSEKRYRLLFNSGYDALFVYHPPDYGEVPKFIEVNDILCQKLGYSRRELLKLSPREIVSGYNEAAVASRIIKLFDKKHILYEDMFLTKTGGIIPVEISAHLFEFNERPTIMSIARDITARKRAQEQIREQAALLDKAQDAILVFDLNDYVIYWNKSAERLYGWEMEEALGNNVFDLIFKENSIQFFASRRSALEYGEWQGELQQVTQKRKEIIVESRWTLVHNNQGEARSILMVNTDVSEKKKIEAQFLRAQRMESIGALAGGIAHDLNNVLAPILTAVQILQLKYSDGKSKRIINTIESNVKRGADMVKQILTFARGVEGERSPIQVQNLILDLQNILMETLPKFIKISVDYPTNLWAVSGDATQLHQVLLNLCVNARDAMPENGQLKITASNLVIDEAFIRTHIEAKIGNYVVIKVQDSGLGIPGNIINKIFEPFFTTKEPGKGTGLGLSTVIAIVKSHNGFVNVFSDVNKGTTFEIFLPALEEGEFIEPEIIESKLLHGNGETILIIDDETSIVEITRETLETYGYNVVCAYDGAEGVEVYTKNKNSIDIVISDMMMPVLDGTATMRALKQIDSNVKIIASSGFINDEKITETIDSIEAFLHKPYTAEKLLNTLHGILNKKIGLNK